MNNRNILLCILACTFLASCLDQSKKTENKRSAAISTSSETYSYDNDLFQNPYKNEKTDKARRLWSSVLSDKENGVFSPLSLEAVLTLLMQGSKGESYQALENFLQLKGTKPLEHLLTLKEAVDHIDHFHRDYNENAPTKMKLAFGLVSSKKYSLDPETVNPVKNQLGLYMESYDFKRENQKALDGVNSWIEKMTEDKVKKLLDMISEETVMLLINTLYLKSSWQDKFKEESNQKVDFTLDMGSAKKVEMMYKKEHFNYVKDEHFQAVQVLIDAPDIEFWFLRPEESIEKTKEHIAKTPLKTLFDSRYSQKIELFLPKFKIKNKLKLMSVLRKEGLEILTQSPNLELDGFLKEKGDFIISEAIQGNFFAVDENGVEAASATVLGMRAGGMPKPEEPLVLKFDKPFLFLMYQKSSGRMLFEGQVYDPELN